jgi:hypothetical protein
MLRAPDVQRELGRSVCRRSPWRPRRPRRPRRPMAEVEEAKYWGGGRCGVYSTIYYLGEL